MLMTADLTSFGASPELVEVWKKHIPELTDIQEKAVRARVLDGVENVLAVAPTSSGKTFIGEMAATASAYTRRRHAIFIVPFRALAEEHFELFRERYDGLLTVVMSTSDRNESDADIRAGNFNLAVMTYEKLMGFLVQRPDLIERCTALVVDEVQSLSGGTRGATLEMLLTQVMLSPKPPQIIALSASLDNLGELDSWLKARPVVSSERPVPLTQSVCELSGSAIIVAGEIAHSTRQLVAEQPDRNMLALALAERFIGEGKQVIVFRSTIRNVENTARDLRGRLSASGLPQYIDERVNELEDSDAIAELRLGLAAGVGFHTADLTYPERRLVEDAFRLGDARALVATTTLAMGVNLPCDVVIVADSTRYTPSPEGWRQHEIPVAEYRNAAGRAGRLGKRTAGFSVLLAEDAIEQRQLVNGYLLGPVEPVESQIPKQVFADIVFRLIASGIADHRDAVVEFITSTFAYTTFYAREGGGLEGMRNGVEGAVATCLASGFVVPEEGRLRATQIGRMFAGAGLSLASSARLAALLERATKNEQSLQDLVFEIASCPEIGNHPWPLRERGFEKDPRPNHVPDGSGCWPDSRLAATLAKSSITTEERKALVKAKCLLDWMGGASQRTISTRFRGMGAANARVRDLGRNAAWLFDTLAGVALASTASQTLIQRLRTFALEARHGLPAPLAPLARLRVPGITREQLLRLYRNERGIELYELEQILDAPDEQFDGLLTPTQLARLRLAILTDIEESLRRKHAGQLARAGQASLPAKLVDDLYTATGHDLEQAVTDALKHVGLSATRVLHQPSGEEDVRLAHTDGTVVISVTASQDDARTIRWNKAKAILGTGAGLNPVNYVCIGRPGFGSLAERHASEIARETGPRSILLVPIPVLAEAVVRISEEKMTGKQLGDLLARERGVVMLEDLPEPTSQDKVATVPIATDPVPAK
jgi:helicase